MPNQLLAINTTTRECSVALIANEDIYSASEYSERGHDGIVLGLIEQVLQESGLSKKDISCLAFGRGPGAFTGIRVATAVTQGLAVGLNLKVIPVSDLLNVAYQHHQATGHKRVAVSFDARMGEVYAAVYEFAENNYQLAIEEQLAKPEQFLHQLELLSNSLVGVGNGFSEFSELNSSKNIIQEESNFALFPTALATAQLAQWMLILGYECVDAFDALPVYLRNDVAHKKK